MNTYIYFGFNSLLLFKLKGAKACLYKVQK